MEGHEYRTRTVPVTASPSTPHEADLGCAARLCLNIDARLMPVDRRAPENLCVWYRLSAPPRSAPHVSLSNAIVADLGLACDATAVTLRLDGYAVSSADVLRDGDVVHVCASHDRRLDAAHGGPWPVLSAPMASDLRDAPATDPSAARPHARLAVGERRARGSERSRDWIVAPEAEARTTSSGPDRAARPAPQRDRRAASAAAGVASFGKEANVSDALDAPARAGSDEGKSDDDGAFAAGDADSDSEDLHPVLEPRTAPAKRPRLELEVPVSTPETRTADRSVPAANARSAPLERGRSRSARRKALKRARKRAASFGERREASCAPRSAADGREARATGATGATGRSTNSPDRGETRVPATFLPADAALDPNGDLARRGGALVGWPEREWAPHPSESVLRAAESALAARASTRRATRPEKSVALAPSTTTTDGNARKLVFDDGDASSESSSSSAATTASDADVPRADADARAAESDSGDARAVRAEAKVLKDREDREDREDRAETRTTPRTRPSRSRVRAEANPSGGATRARLESLVAADHTLANQSAPVPGIVDPEDAGAALLPGDVVRYRYRDPEHPEHPEHREHPEHPGARRRGDDRAFACSYFQGEVVSVEPDFGDAGGVRLAVTIAPWPERRRTEALVCAARAAAEAETSGGGGLRVGTSRAVRLPAPFDATCVATVGTRDVLEARLIGGPRHVTGASRRD